MKYIPLFFLLLTSTAMAQGTQQLDNELNSGVTQVTSIISNFRSAILADEADIGKLQMQIANLNQSVKDLTKENQSLTKQIETLTKPTSLTK